MKTLGSDARSLNINTCTFEELEPFKYLGGNLNQRKSLEFINNRLQKALIPTMTYSFFLN